MATKTKSQVADLVLENLGVKPATQSASSEDGTLAEAAIDTAHDQLQKRGLAPYAISAVPEWAQIPLRDYVSADLVNVYGISGERLQVILGSRQRALSEMAAQVSTGTLLPQSQSRYY